MKQKLSGRLRITQKLCSDFDGFSLSIGSKEIRFANINADIEFDAYPDILADVCFSPFKSETFDLIYFTEVIEHLPNGSEQLALREIYRMLKKGGTLILTTPHDNRLFTVLDLARYIVTHRHYKKERIDYLLNECNFNIDQIFIAGGSWECVCNLWYFLITFPMKKLELNRIMHQQYLQNYRIKNMTKGVIMDILFFVWHRANKQHNQLLYGASHAIQYNRRVHVHEGV